MTAKRKEPLAGGPKRDAEQQQFHKPTGGRREVQGMRGDRNRCQAAPTWPELPGERALRQLEALWGAPRIPIVRRRR